MSGGRGEEVCRTLRGAPQFCTAGRAMRSTFKSWPVLLSVTLALCGPALAGCTLLGDTSMNDSLNSVSCLSADSCVAVGTAATVTGQTETMAPAAMRWDGSQWHALAVPLPSGGVQGQLSGVSCKPGGCLAVGNYSPREAGFLPLAEYWNDSAWTAVPLTFPPGPPRPSLRAVSCVTAAQCVATGSYGKLGGFASALAATWDGRKWSWSRPPVRATGTPGNRTLAGVSCVTATYCMAIGNAYDTGADSTGSFAETWNGHGWTFAPVPGAGEATGLSCARAGSCAVAGTLYDGDSAGFGQLLDSTHWTRPVTPWPGTVRSYLYGVSCAGKTCLAVGEAEPSAGPNGNATHPAALTWNGVTWTRLATPKGVTGTLQGVTCVTADDCIAVGSQRGGNGTTTLSEFWNGTAWTIVSTA